MSVARQVVLTVTGAALVVGGVIAVGELLRDRSPPRPGSQFAVADIDCDPPPGKTRAEFLGEVHYYGRLPESLDAADPETPERLTAAFLKHPKVKDVEKVTIIQPNKVHVVVDFKREP
jgi:hypothetical protein